jgi:hypothetical protein
VHEHAFFRRDGMNLFWRDPGELHNGHARRRNPGADARRSRDGEGAEGTQTGTTLRLKAGNAGRQRTRAWRSVRDRPGPDAAEADPGSAKADRGPRQGAADRQVRAARGAATSRTSGTSSIASRTCSAKRDGGRRNGSHRETK